MLRAHIIVIKYLFFSFFFFFVCVCVCVCVCVLVRLLALWKKIYLRHSLTGAGILVLDEALHEIEIAGKGLRSY